MADDPHGSRRIRRADVVVFTLIVVTCLPVLLFRYLPMVDLPQHMAIAGVLAHPEDPTLGYQDYYTVDYGGTLYLLPYIWTVALSKWL